MGVIRTLLRWTMPASGAALLAWTTTLPVDPAIGALTNDQFARIAKMSPDDLYALLDASGASTNEKSAALTVLTWDLEACMRRLKVLAERDDDSGDLARDVLEQLREQSKQWAQPIPR